MKKVLLVDVFNLFIRCFVKNVEVNSQGRNIGSVNCSLVSLYYFCKQFNPDIVYLCYEGKNSGQRRRKSYHDYKDGKKSPHTISQFKEVSTKGTFWKSLELFQDILDCLPFNVLSVNYLEADDIISFLVNKLSPDDEKIIISTDKDYFQLISDKVKVYSPTKKIIFNKDNFFEEWKIFPKNYLILKAFIGDSSDNIKKIPIKRLGIKTIIKLFPELSLIEFDDLEHFINYFQKKNDIKIKDILTQDIIEILKNNYNIMNLINLSTISSTNYDALKNKALSETELDLTNFRLLLLKNEIPFVSNEGEFSFQFKRLCNVSTKYKEYIRTFWERIPVSIS